MVRQIVVAALIGFVATAAFAEVENADVALLSPAEVSIGATQTFTFVVTCASSDGEAVCDVHISFPDGFTLHEPTMAYVPLSMDPLRPDWAMYVPPVDHTAIWEDANEGIGELCAAEGCQVSIDVTAPVELTGTPVFWCVFGDGTGDEPHNACGCVDLDYTPVTETSWTSVKALYR